MACTSCKKVVSDSDRITCRGYCGNSFHLICVKVDYSLHEALGTHSRNVFWMCDGCADVFSNEHFRKITSRCTVDNLPDDVSLKSLKDDIAGLKEIVSVLSVKVDCKPRTPVLKPSWQNTLGCSPVPNTPKRKREDDQSTGKAPNIRGTNSACDLVKTVPPQEELLWIYLSAFDPSTSDDEIAALTINSMNLGPEVKPKVIRLVPKDKDPATLSFVTFKVGVSKDLKNVALAKETWPENVYFREFENYSKNRRVIRIGAIPPPDAGGQ